MKKTIYLLLILVLLLALCACGTSPAAVSEPSDAPPAAAEAPVPEPAAETPAQPPEEDGTVYRMRVIETLPDGTLLLARETGNIYVVSLDAAEKVLLDGEPYDPIEPGAYQMLPGWKFDGLTVDVCCSGIQSDEWPMEFDSVASLRFYSIGTPECPGGTCFDLCGLYLQVLEDLWNADDGLNGGAKYISVDLSDAPGGLSEGEKSAVVWAFAGAHGAEPLTLSYEELVEQGHLTAWPDTENLYEWEDGLLFTIRDSGDPADVYSLPVVRFDAEKWRTPLGAIFFSDCSALWPEIGTWTEYNTGAFAIS